MDRLYKKSKLWFALCWIGVYVIGTGGADRLSELVGMPKLVTVLFTGVLCGIILLWLRKHDLLGFFGICRPAASARAFLFYLPLAAIVSCNLWLGVRMNMPPVETVLYVLSMVGVGFLEEIIFRGFLFRAMEPDGLKSAVIVSSLTFGIGHIVNLFNGSGAELLPNLCQVCYAAAAGFLFVIIFYRSGSLLPCIATHIGVNCLSAFANETGRTPLGTVITALILTAISLGYAIILLKTLPKKENNGGNSWQAVL